jgi:hypothetical protein
LDKQGFDFSDRDILVGILNAVLALSARLGGGQLVVTLHSEKTGRAVTVHAAPEGAAFGGAGGEQSVPVQAALLGKPGNG